MKTTKFKYVNIHLMYQNDYSTHDKASQFYSWLITMKAGQDINQMYMISFVPNRFSLLGLFIFRSSLSIAFSGSSSSSSCSSSPLLLCLATSSSTGQSSSASFHQRSIIVTPTILRKYWRSYLTESNRSQISPTVCLSLPLTQVIQTPGPSILRRVHIDDPSYQLGSKFLH